MPQYERPEKGACDAMVRNYCSDELGPCNRKARWRIDGHDLCKRHAELIAFEMAVETKEAAPINEPHPGDKLTFIQDG